MTYTNHYGWIGVTLTYTDYLDMSVVPIASILLVKQVIWLSSISCTRITDYLYVFNMDLTLLVQALLFNRSLAVLVDLVACIPIIWIYLIS